MQKRGILITVCLKALQQAHPTNSTIIPRIKHGTNCLSSWVFRMLQIRLGWVSGCWQGRG